MIEVPERVKDALREGNMLKNYRFNVLNEDGTVDFVIENNNLVKESVKFDERMATGKDLKFGLCEGSSLEFQYFDFPNITGRELQTFIDVQYKDENNDLAWHTIPMGFFTVDQCPMQFSTGIRKVTAYNKLKSVYLDEKANAYLNDIFVGSTQNAYIQDIINALLDGYGIVPYEVKIIQASTGQYAASRDGTNINLKQLYGNHIFNAAPLWENAPTSTSATWNTSVLCSVANYVIPYTPSEDNYIQIRVADYFDDIDDQIYDFITGTFYDCFSSTTATNLINNLKNFTSTEYILEYQKYWGFGFRIIHYDDTEEFYGSTLLKTGRAVGNFADLNKITLHNVKQVIFSQYSTFFILYNGMQANVLRCFGSLTQEYHWSESRPTSTSDYYTAQYSIPTPFEDTPLQFLPTTDDLKVYLLEGFDGIATEIVDVPTLPDVTLRELQSAVYEVNCQYGQISRTTNLFSGITLNNSRLLPADDLYPDNGLYPGGNSLRGNPSMYQRLWTDSQGVQTFRYLIITYKTTEDGQEVEKTLQRTVNADGTTDYNMSSNWLFKNLVWTAEDVGDYADAMVEKMRNVSWFPFEMWCAGLPYLETGDEIEITTSEGTYTSYILQRQLNGIHNLQDTYIDGELDIF